MEANQPDHSDAAQDLRMKIVNLTPAELAFAIIIAVQRCSTKNGSGKFNKEGMSSFASHFIGVIGEMAAARIFKTKISQEVLPNGDGHKADMIAGDGRPLEIKTCTFVGEDAMIKLSDNELFDDMYYVLVIVRLPDLCQVYPAISGKVIRANAIKKNFNYGFRNTVTAKFILDYTTAEQACQSQ